jgi:hypothetical protein|tara:strand:- start:205 stop:492 length:288 start_codon:yes stop_codon:yes gene_type:complete
MKENVDYEIIPDKADDQAWNVRVLQGPYTETVLKFGTITLKEKNMSFNFDIIYSPDSELKTEDVNLQTFAGDMLEKIIAQGIKDGDVITREMNAN